MNFDKLENLIDMTDSVYGIPNCDISVYYKHREVFRKQHGCVDPGRKKKASADDLYMLYSASKVTLATAAMQLVEQGRIRLDDPVSAYLPEYGAQQVREGDRIVPCEREATIEDLLSMRGGLDYKLLIPGARPDFEAFMRENPDAPTREVIRQYLQTPLRFQPGTRWLYSMCLDAMGAVIETVTGEKYRDYVKDHIARPLGMRDFALHVADVDQERLVCQYRYNPAAAYSPEEPQLIPIGKTENVGVPGTNYDAAGAGVITRVSDYVLLADALANDGTGANGARILTRKSIDEMRKPRTVTEVCQRDYSKLGDYGYGYGLGVRTLVNPRASKSPVGEFGWDGMGGAWFMSDPENHLAVFFLMSVVGKPDIKPAIHHRIRDYTYEAMAEELTHPADG